MMRVCAVSFSPIPGRIEENISRIVEIVTQERAHDFILFPELSDTGYTLQADQVKPYCRQTVFAPLQDILSGSNTVVSLGLAEHLNGGIYNTIFEISATSIVPRYRKTHLFPGEERLFRQGDFISLYSSASAVYGYHLCYDIRYPELTRTLFSYSGDILFVSAAWPAKRIDHWRSLLVARAIENQVYVVAANQNGVLQNYHFGGQSMILSPRGEILQESSENTECVRACLSLSLLREYRREFPLRSSRCNDISFL
ncbi:nitrilase-related carbon-nitrogen hydrolase [Chitinivibrio alkaliphilus]|uniref:Amidohydrolase n=1 Tax=Chitinivibrio alkaliphilus ACht1 TaxID=1313304 RepID=U7D8S3_9BACT|nr:nitrilase-related carbon-nitrogen hydrolase [Chitinivibrio alkaliphilus]ERP39335.1 amidohydrolase [Chitinivibrio alkaliphilus ACht1]